MLASLVGHVGASLGLYAGNLHAPWGILMLGGLKLYGGVLGLLCGCMSAWRVLSYEACWKSFGGCMRCVGRSLGLYVGNLQVLWGVLERVWGSMLAPYKSYGGCWSGFGVVFWQPARLMGHVGAGVGCMLATYRSYGACWNGFGCMLATYRSYGACLNGFGAVPMGRVGTGPCCNGFWTVCWQPTGPMGRV